MPKSVNALYAMEGGDSLTAEECARINEELAALDPRDVPRDQIDNVLSYLDRQFLYQQVEPAISAKLEELVSSLRAAN